MVLPDQFERLRAGDRFWYQNDGLFEDVWMEYIEGSTLSHIITS
ncbi:MAG: peroxidase family protein, partial [Planctomycetota bacterium]